MILPNQTQETNWRSADPRHAGSKYEAAIHAPSCLSSASRSVSVSRLRTIGVISDRHQIMKDPLFWTRLAFTSCGLLRESGDKSLHGLWIDDFMPESATDTKHGVDVEGTAWVGDGSRAMHPYRFIVSVPQRMLHRRRDSFSIQRFDLDQDQQMLQVEIGHEKSLG